MRTETDTTSPRVGIIGCGLIGQKRADSLPAGSLAAVYDTDGVRSEGLASKFRAINCKTTQELLDLQLDVIVVSTVHNALAELACAALYSGAHVLVEKPAGISVAEIDSIIKAAEVTNRRVKVGFNHRFHPGIMRAITEARSGAFGKVLYLRGRYGHGGRLGYEKEWRADKSISGGGEIVDQGMHLLDLSYWLLGELPMNASLLRTQYWHASVDDNAVLVLGEKGGVGSSDPFSLIHVSWTDWKNTFSLEIACETAKIAVDGLVRSYGPQVLRIYKMRPELGPPDLEELTYPDEDQSWTNEWVHFMDALHHESQLLGDLKSARYAWSCVEKAQTQ